MKKANYILLVLIALLMTSGFSYAKTETLSLGCTSCALIDQNSGRLLYTKNAENILPMASTTKIMTALVAIENGKLTDHTKVSKKASSVRGSTAKLSEGEDISLEELLYGLMLRSGNDCAIAIAEMIGGSVPQFSDLMNKKALEVGAYNTKFCTPHGLDSDNHYTTAKDLAKITAYAMQNEEFTKIVSTKEISEGISGRFNRPYSNINKFLYRMEDSDGVKTGFTAKAGKCLVASVHHPHGRYICVVLNSSDRWKDAENLVKYAKKNYEFVNLLSKEKSKREFKVYGSKCKYLSGHSKDDIFFPILHSEQNQVKLEVYAPSVLFSPIKKDEPLGSIVVKINDTVQAKYTILSDNAIDRNNLMNSFTETFISNNLNT